MPTHYRMIVSALAAFLIASLAPVSAGSAGLAAAASITAALFLAVAAQHAWVKREEIRAHVCKELHAWERVAALGKLLGHEPRHRQWSTDVQSHLHAYLTAFDKKAFSRYADTQDRFRGLVASLRQLPASEGEKERLLFQELFEATRTATEARWLIGDLWTNRVTPIARHGLGLLTGLAGFAILMSMGPSDRAAAGYALATIAAALVFVRDFEAMNDLAGEELSKRYVESAALHA